MAIGEAGSLTRGDFTFSQADGPEVVRVDFTETIENPVIHLSSTNFGGNEFSLRVVSVDSTGFSFSVEEWEDEDGPHPVTETINWLAIETGVHVLPDGRIIEAGTTSATTTTSQVELDGNFIDTPAVLTNVMSRNETDVVDSDPFNIDADGFDVRLEEGSDVDGVHAAETVGYIAIGTGGNGESGFAVVEDGLDSGNTVFDVGTTLNDGVIFAETQTANEAGAGNVVINDNPSADGSTPNINLRFDEETGDGNSAHGDEDVAIVGFEEGLIMCLAAGTLIDTDAGPIAVERLRGGDQVLSLDGRYQRLRRAFHRTVSSIEFALNPRLRPVRISSGALGQGLPRRDLLVSRQHRMLVNSPIARRMFDDAEVLIAAIQLTALPGIFVDEEIDAVTYVHLLFDDHQIVYADGAPTESLFPGQEALKALPQEALREIQDLFPALVDPTLAVASAKPIPKGARQRQLVARHAKNTKPLLNFD